MLGEIYKQEDGTLAARTLAGPVAGTVQKQVTSQNYDYEVLLADTCYPSPCESYVAVSDGCPVTYNPSTGVFSVCTLKAGQVTGDLDSTRVTIATTNANLNQSIPFLGCVTTVGDSTFGCVCYDNKMTYNPSTCTLTVCNLCVDCIEGQADADRVIVDCCNTGTIPILHSITTADGVTTAKISQNSSVTVDATSLTVNKSNTCVCNLCVNEKICVNNGIITHYDIVGYCQDENVQTWCIHCDGSGYFECCVDTSQVCAKYVDASLYVCGQTICGTSVVRGANICSTGSVTASGVICTTSNLTASGYVCACGNLAVRGTSTVLGRMYSCCRPGGSWCSAEIASIMVPVVTNNNNSYFPVLGMCSNATNQGWSLGTLGADFYIVRKDGSSNSGATYKFCSTCSACGGTVLTSGNIGSYGFTTCQGTVKACLCGTVLCLGT